MRSVWRNVLLSPGILVSVFEYLDTRSKGRVAQVCQTWRDIAYTPRVWRDVVVSRISPRSLIDLYIRRGIRRLRPSEYTFDLAEWTRGVGEFLARRGETGTKTAVEVHVDLRGFVNRVTDKTLATLLTTVSTSLRSLVLYQCGSITLKSLGLIVAQCPHLEELGFTHRSFPTMHLRPVSLDVCGALRKLKQLRTVDLRSNGINDEFFRSFAVDSCLLRPRVAADTLSLTRLLLDHNDRLTGTSLKFIGRHLPLLSELSLDGCQGITYDSMQHLSSMRNLRHVSLPCLRSFDRDFKLRAYGDQGREYYNDIGVKLLARSGVLGRLHSLSVVGVSDQAMDAIVPCAYDDSDNTTSGRLVSLRIFEGVITDHSLALLANHSSSSVCGLRQLKLVFCERITDDGIESLTSSGRLVGLRDLDLEGCTMLRDDSLAHITRGFPRLHSIVLRGCRSISDVGVRPLVTGCRQLRSLDLSFTYELTDDTLTDIATNLDLLEVLFIYEPRRPNSFSETAGFKKLLQMPMLKTMGWTFQFAFEEGRMRVINGEAHHWGKDPMEKDPFVAER